MRKRSLWTKHSTSLCGLPWRQPAAHPLGPAQLRASRAAVKALSQAELPLQRTRLLSAHVPFSGDLFSLLISEWMWLWGQVGLLSAGGEEPASGSSYQPAAQQTKGQSFQVPWCAPPLSPVSTSQSLSAGQIPSSHDPDYILEHESHSVFRCPKGEGDSKCMGLFTWGS